MWVPASLSALLFAGVMSSIATASPLVASYANPVEPTPELTAFLQSLVASAQEGIGSQSRAYAVLDDMIAPNVRGFQRGLDPFEPWSEIDLTDPDRGSGLDLLTAWMVEQGDIVDGATDLPDYRQDFLELLVRIIADPNEPLGLMPGMGDAVCSPAQYDVDADEALAFAQAQDTDGYGIYIFPRLLDLYENPTSIKPAIARVSPRTLLTSIYEADQPDGWIKVVASDGTTGWAEDRGDYEGLSQQHLCFGEVDGKYMITAFFSYGL